MRFAAAFAVVLFHIGSGYQIAFGNSSNPFSFGAMGVDVFFVLSGFIIAMTTDPEKGSWHFCRRRLVRVVPLYWLLTLGIAAIALVMPSLLNSTVVTPETLIKSLFFIPYERATGVVQPLLFLGWTLNYEMFFYAIYALCIGVGLRSPLAPVTVVVLLVLAGQLFPYDSVLWRFYSNPLMLEFAIGVGLYLVHSARPELFQGRTALLSGLAVGMYLLLHALPGVPWIVASAVPATLIVAAFVAFSPGPSRWLGLAVIGGDASYSLYLSHPYVIQLIAKVSPDAPSLMLQIVLGVVSCVICIAASVVLYRGVERGFQQRLFIRSR